MQRFCEANVIVLDTSGSMGEKDTSNNKSRLENAKDAIFSLAQERKKEADLVDCHFKVVPFDISPKLNMFDVTSGDVPSGVRQLQPDNNTAIYTSLAIVLGCIVAWFERLSPTHINLILLTDGDDNSSTDALKRRFSELESALQSRGLGKLYCACYVISKQPNQSFLKQLSAVMPVGSEVVHVRDATTLEPKLVTFAEQTADRGEERFKKVAGSLIKDLEMLVLNDDERVVSATKDAIMNKVGRLTDWKV